MSQQPNIEPRWAKPIAWPIERERAALAADGYVIIADAMARETMAAVAREIEPWFERTPRCEGDFYGWRTTRVGGLLNKAASVRRLVLHPRILALVEAMLAPSCDCIQLNLTQAIRVHPGERAQAPHRDEEMWPLDPKPGTWLVNVMWPLVQFTAANGATRLWPGSHTRDLDRSIDPAGAVAAEMAPGSALVFLGSLTHGAGANVDEAPRDGVIVSYCLGWLKQYENQFLAYPQEVARDFPETLQRLIGYRMHRPNLGNWEGQDPIARLQATRDELRPHADALTPEIARQLREFYGG